MKLIFLILCTYFSCNLTQAFTDSSKVFEGYRYCDLVLNHSVPVIVEEQIQEMTRQLELKVNNRIAILNQRLEEENKGEFILETIQENLPETLLPKDATLKELVLSTNRFLQDPNRVFPLIFEFYQRVLNIYWQAEKTLPSSNFLEVNGLGALALKTLANELGWEKIDVIIDMHHPDEFRRNILEKGVLFYDTANYNSAHTSSAHLLQFILVTQFLDNQFGKGSANSLFAYLGTKEGFPLWEFLFDRGPNFYKDFRGPVIFYILNLVKSKQSLLGID